MRKNLVVMITYQLETTVNVREEYEDSVVISKPDVTNIHRSLPYTALL